jgi:hypothetical protein
MKRLFVTMIALLLLFAPAFASVGVQDDGTARGTAADINFTEGCEVAEFGSVAIVKVRSPLDETAATPDTLTTSQSGMTFIATSSAAGGKNFDLPDITSDAAYDGLTYTFVYGPPSKVANGTVQIVMDIEPQDTDNIVYKSRLADGTGIKTSISNADSYPSVTLRSFGGEWFVTSMTGAWETM